MQEAEPAGANAAAEALGAAGKFYSVAEVPADAMLAIRASERSGETALRKNSTSVRNASTAATWLEPARIEPVRVGDIVWPGGEGHEIAIIEGSLDAMVEALDQRPPESTICAQTCFAENGTIEALVFGVSCTASRTRRAKESGRRQGPPDPDRPDAAHPGIRPGPICPGPICPGQGCQGPIHQGPICTGSICQDALCWGPICLIADPVTAPGLVAVIADISADPSAAADVVERALSRAFAMRRHFANDALSRRAAGTPKGSIKGKAEGSVKDSAEDGAEDNAQDSAENGTGRGTEGSAGGQR